jgi:DNA-binding response OmpR family regulator
MNDNTPQNQTGKNILCIEDEHFISELYTRALTKAGYNVTSVYDGIEGLAQAKTNQFDVILLDIMIPNMKGTEILTRLRSETPNLRAKVIVTTNLDQGDDGRADVEKLADGYIIKANITPKELVKYLEAFDPSVFSEQLRQSDNTKIY